MNLAQAITDLRDDIEAEGYDAEIMAEIAKDNGCAPQLLERKFAEQYGVAPAEYVVPEDMTDKMVARAMEKAAEIASKFTSQGSMPHGRVFTDPTRNKQFVTVGFSGNNFHMIRVDSLELRYMKFNNKASCINYATKLGLFE